MEVPIGLNPTAQPTSSFFEFTRKLMQWIETAKNQLHPLAPFRTHECDVILDRFFTTAMRGMSRLFESVHANPLDTPPISAMMIDALVWIETAKISLVPLVDTRIQQSNAIIDSLLANLSGELSRKYISSAEHNLANMHDYNNQVHHNPFNFGLIQADANSNATQDNQTRADSSQQVEAKIKSGLIIKDDPEKLMQANRVNPGAIKRSRRLYDCPECDKSFVTEFSRLGHIRAVHRKVRPFECGWPNCEYAASCKGPLIVHINKHIKKEVSAFGRDPNEFVKINQELLN